LELTTLAIIGNGIAGRSLLFNLTRENNKFQKILLFSAPAFLKPCSFYTTSIVAPRGVTSGHSDLGDLIVEGFSDFSEHVKKDKPSGIFPISQFTGATTKIDQFKTRYPGGKFSRLLEGLPHSLKNEIYLAQEDAFMIDPEIYLPWLSHQAEKALQITYVESLVTEVRNGGKVYLRTNNNEEFEVDQLVFAAGAYGRFYKSLFPGEKIESSKPVQGSYLRFSKMRLGEKSFSLTLNGANLIYRAHSQEVLIGSTTDDFIHELPHLNELRRIFSELKALVAFEVPVFESGEILVGHREKARKREPYILRKGNLLAVGGLYKNGFSLSLKMTKILSRQYLLNAQSNQ
jgi:hypothetical protein